MDQLDQIRPSARAPDRNRDHRIRLAPPPIAIGERIERRRLTDRLAGVVLHPDDGLGMRIDEQANGLAGELERHLEAPALVRHRAILAHQTADAVQEQRIELRRQRSQRTDLRQVLLVAGQRRLAIEARMRAAVIDLLQPGPQARVEIVETQDLAFIDLAEKLIAAGAVPALELPLALR
jgi:hypothetical protein